MSNNKYVVRSDNGKFSLVFKQNNFCGLGWFKNNQESIHTFDLDKAKDKAYVKQYLSEDHPDKSNKSIGILAGMIWRFINEVKVGDTIFSPTQKTVMIGRVASDSYLELTSEYDGIIRRKIDWNEEVSKDSLSDEIRNKMYCNSTFFSLDEEVFDIDEEVVDDFPEILSDSTTYSGFTYLMSSQVFDNTYKIGKANDVEKRELELSKCNRYGVFKLKSCLWIETRDPRKMEKLLQNYFEKWRLSIKTGLKVDTELFRTEANLHKLIQDFITYNYLNNPDMKDEVIGYSWYSK